MPFVQLEMTETIRAHCCCAASIQELPELTQLDTDLLLPASSCTGTQALRISDDHKRFRDDGGAVACSIRFSKFRHPPVCCFPRRLTPLRNSPKGEDLKGICRRGELETISQRLCRRLYRPFDPLTHWIPAFAGMAPCPSEMS